MGQPETLTDLILKATELNAKNIGFLKDDINSKMIILSKEHTELEIKVRDYVDQKFSLLEKKVTLALWQCVGAIGILIAIIEFSLKYFR